jgi:hypothetical protein
MSDILLVLLSGLNSPDAKLVDAARIKAEEAAGGGGGGAQKGGRGGLSFGDMFGGEGMSFPSLSAAGKAKEGGGKKVRRGGRRGLVVAAWDGVMFRGNVEGTLRESGGNVRKCEGNVEGMWR